MTNVDNNPTDGLIDRWMGLCDALSLAGDRGELLGAGRELVGMYSSDPRRTYHNVGHLEACLRALEEVRELTDDAPVVAAGLWFHDAVYVPGAGDNEPRSAELAAEMLGRLGVDTVRLEAIAKLINITSHQDEPESHDEQLICDIDLAILGKPWGEYSRYAASVRWEYAVPNDQFASGRSAFLRNMLGREHIYHTRRFGDQYEQTARENMQRELVELAG
ncbi:MAG: hypothetical protein HN350_12460 [Phycisphaerales bacterium]|nr:hypothetical protein [Phycisphaerales bacterium]